MINYDAFFSRAAGHMKASAIRKMGGVAAEGRDIVSFAPGFPAPETFPWLDFQEIARRAPVGPERIGAPVRPDARLPTARRGDRRGHGEPRGADRARPAARHDRLAAGPRPRRARPARPARCDARRAADLHRRHLRIPQRAGRDGGRPAGGRRHRSRRARRHLRAASAARAAARGSCIWCRTSRTRRGCSSDGPSAPRCSTGRSAATCSRRRRSVPGPVFRGLGDGSRRPADPGRRRVRARRLPEQLLEDAGARIPGRVDRRARRLSPPSSRSPSRRPTSAPASSISASSTRPAGGGFSIVRRRSCAALPAQARRDGARAHARVRRRRDVAAAARRLLPLGDAARTPSTPTR